MKHYKYIYALLIGSLLFITGCKEKDIVNEHDFGNAVYVTSQTVTDDLLIKPSIPTSSRKITYRVAMPLEEESVQIHFDADRSLVAAYNLMYNDKAEALAEKYYNIPKKSATIIKNAISSDDIEVNFENTHELDNSKRYVLPVTIVDSDIKVMDGKRTVYYIFKGAALINVVANIHYVYFPITWQTPVNNLSVVTVEALIRSKDWIDERGNSLSSVFGKEGHFLVRIGDSDRPRDQLQVAAPGGNFPPANVVPGLPVNEWIHIAIVYNNISKERIFYKNGEKVYSDKGAAGNINLTTGTYIGRAWDDERYLPGDISELRVWNYERSAEEIASLPYEVDPASNGLIAYWKFNEGTGNTVADHSQYGTNLEAKPYKKDAVISWVDVELPPVE